MSFTSETLLGGLIHLIAFLSLRAEDFAESLSHKVFQYMSIFLEYR